jgi:8-oxo-dGTP pyrophosphatase MutT (NUDIX family)
MSRPYTFCNNCGRGGHGFHQCKQPITSVGIIAFRQGVAGKLEYLMIRRKDSLGFVDFVRGKYPLYARAYIANIIGEMTQREKQRLLEGDFDSLWRTLWGQNVGIQYRGEERNSRDKFQALRSGVTARGTTYDLNGLVEESAVLWTEPEWGFPKGRRNYQERDLHCALREFEEETGYRKSDLCVLQNLLPIEEVFTGSNYKSYKHKYYLAQLAPEASPRQPFQNTEVSMVEWKACRDAMNAMRPYNLEKKAVMARADALLHRYRLYPQYTAWSGSIG